MESATVHSAAQTTGWSVRMLHYLEAAGLVTPARSASGYRLYGEREITHLRALRQLLADHDLRPADLQVALRLRSEPVLRAAVDHWLNATSAAGNGEGDGLDVASTAPARESNSPTAQHPVPAADPSISWLRFEQDKHSRALQAHRELQSHRELQASREPQAHSHPTPKKETA